MDLFSKFEAQQIKDFDKILHSHASLGQAMLRERLLWISKILYPKPLRTFPRIKYLDSHLDFVNSYGIEIPTSLKQVLLGDEFLSRILVESAVLNSTLIFRPNGLFVYKTRDSIPLSVERAPASAIQYILYGRTVLNEMLKVRKKAGFDVEK